ncbi:hypothetical protein [Synechococcus sp. CBW1108]|uniref:hypothetical protein n=1 Tax=Synechococcus sp. CBW1108 TaxID=1353147 RepID=UPI0018CD5CB7|nr:hypothetical protein [Synechococcus sp. CBW1108]QPN69847.1 hypothetical protein H8F27_15600 [Synechococcus sp. CBW1108]
MTPVLKENFLAIIHADSQLQKALLAPSLCDIAIKIARAAGMGVDGPDLLAAQADYGHISNDLLPDSEPILIDFDGDGVPDAIQRGDRVSLLGSDD